MYQPSTVIIAATALAIASGGIVAAFSSLGPSDVPLGGAPSAELEHARRVVGGGMQQTIVDTRRQAADMAILAAVLAFVGTQHQGPQVASSGGGIGPGHQAETRPSNGSR